MSTPGAEAAGGPVNPGELVPPLDPYTAARARFDATLREQAELLAPGLASADWNDWPQEYEPGKAVVPTLVRVGTAAGSTPDEARLPILVPATGESHVLFGDAELARPTPLGDVPPGTEPASVKRMKKLLVQEHADAEAQRRDWLATERPGVVAAMRGIMLRTVATMQPGTVELRLFDPNQGAGFRDFSALGARDTGAIYRVEGGITAQLMKLLDRIKFMNSGGLRGAPSLREYALNSHNHLPTRPFILAAMLGDGRPLTPQNAGLMRYILEEGPACGITVLAHGFDISDNTPHTHRLRPVNATPHDVRLSTPAAANIRFTPDTSPPASLTSRVAGTVAVNHAQTHILQQEKRRGRGDRPALFVVPKNPAGVFTPPSIEDGQGANTATLPGETYRRTVNHAVRDVHHAHGAVAAYRRGFPLIEPEHAAALQESGSRYLNYVAAAAEDPSLLGRHLSQRHRSPEQLDQLQTWAALQLLRETPGNKWNHVRNAWHTSDGTRLLAATMPNLIQAVAITAYHGHDLLPDAVRDWAVESLPLEPPAYVFQLVADHGTHRPLPTNETGHEERALQATMLHLEATYGVHLLGNDGRTINRTLLNALIECELIRLYRAHHPETPSAVRNLVVRRSHRRLEAINRENLPASAQPFYDACMTRLKEIGRIANWRETAANAGAAVLDSAIKGALASNPGLLGIPQPQRGNSEEKGDAAGGAANT